MTPDISSLIQHGAPRAIRPAFQFQTHRATTVLLCLALFLGFSILHLPFRSEYLVNWDAVQFALGTQTFDLEHHQPHPPGYIGYVGLGALLNQFTRDPNSSLTLLSALSGGAAPAALYILGRRFLHDRYSLLTAILFGTSPLVWYYSRVALTYAVEVAVALPFVWACHYARTHHSVGHLRIASLLLSALGALRPSALVLLLPLWIATAWPYPRRPRCQATALLVAATLAWLLPLTWLSGGIVAYLQTGLALAGLVGSETSVLAGNPIGLARNLLAILGLMLGLHLGVGFIVLAYRRRGMPGVLRTGDLTFFLLWGGPALLTFLFGHTGQLGYALLLLPIGFLWLGRSLQSLFGTGTTRLRRPAGGRYIGFGLTAVVASFLVGNLLAVSLLPSTASALLHQAVRGRVSESAGAPTLLATHIRQFDLDLSDAYWRNLISFIRSHNEESTAILAVPAGTGNGTFRHLGYYLPEYRVYALGRDRRGAFGHLFTAYQGSSDYRVEGLNVSRCLLPLPQQVTKLIIPDGEIAESLDPTLPRSVLSLGAENSIVVVDVPVGSFLAVVPAEDAPGRLAVVAPHSLPPEGNWTGADHCVP